MTHSTNIPEGSLDGLLREIGSRGWLDQSLTDADLAWLLSQAPDRASSTFTDKAVQAMQRAQQARRRLSPATLFGNAISSARASTGLDVTQLAQKVVVQTQILELLEQGRMPLSQFLRDYTPTIAARLLKTIRMSFDDFARYLAEWAAPPGNIGGMVAGLPAFRQHSTSDGSSREVAEYLARVEDLMR